MPGKSTKEIEHMEKGGLIKMKKEPIKESLCNKEDLRQVGARISEGNPPNKAIAPELLIDSQLQIPNTVQPHCKKDLEKDQ